MHSRESDVMHPSEFLLMILGEHLPTYNLPIIPIL